MSNQFSDQLLNDVLRQGLMAPNSEWNRMGPVVPRWFLAAIRRFDRNLTLQFMPPASDRIPNGVSPVLYPQGVWAICRRLNRSKMLLKKWTWHLADREGKFSPPGADTVAVLRRACSYYRRGVSEKMEEQLDSWMAQLHSEKHAKSRAGLSNRIYDTIKKNNLFSNIEGRTRVMFRHKVNSAG